MPGWHASSSTPRAFAGPLPSDAGARGRLSNVRGRRSRVPRVRRARSRQAAGAGLQDGRGSRHRRPTGSLLLSTGTLPMPLSFFYPGLILTVVIRSQSLVVLYNARTGRPRRRERQVNEVGSSSSRCYRDNGMTSASAAIHRDHRNRVSSSGRCRQPREFMVAAFRWWRRDHRRAEGSLEYGPFL